MLKGILVGLDGSSFGDSAVSLGLAWAREHGTVLAGLAVVDYPSVGGPGVASRSALLKAVTPQVVESQRRAEAVLARFADRCAEAGVMVRSLQDEGEPAEVIHRHSQRYDLILLGLETYFRYGPQGQPCDTLDKVLHSPPRPVVAVPAELGSGRTAIIGYDGSLQAARTLAAYLGSGLAARYQNLVVTIDEAFEDAAQVAEVAVDYLSLHGVEVTAKPVETRLDPAAVLLDHAPPRETGLVVMGAFGHSKLREYFFGSTTRGVLRQSRVPVFLYH